MKITLASFKGGVSKTTSAVHIAAVLQQKASTALIDGDPNRSATFWSKRGKGLPFAVVDSDNARQARGYSHVVIDTQARPDARDLAALAGSCDLLVIPTAPDVLALDALMQTAELLDRLKAQYRILLTMVAPPPSKSGETVRETLQRQGWPVFKTYIHRLAAFQKAAETGALVAGKGWDEYRALGREITK